MKTALKESLCLIAIVVVSILSYRLYLGSNAADISLPGGLFFEFKMIVTSIILICFTALCLYFSPYILHILQTPDRPPALSVIKTENPVFNRYISPADTWPPVFIKIFLIFILIITSFISGRNAKQMNQSK
jgi:hypothetical protein